MRISRIDSIDTHDLTIIAISIAVLLIVFPALGHAQEVQPLPGPRAVNWRAPARESHWQLLFDLGGNGTEYYYPPSSELNAGESGFTTGAQLTRFITPVVDDGAARSLQPFLERASTASLGFRFAGYGSALTELTPSGKRVVVNYTSDLNFNPNFGLDLYVVRWLALTGGFEYGHDYVFQRRLTTHRFSPHGGIGARFADTRIDASYSFDGYDKTGALGPSFLSDGGWGTLSLDIESVIARHVALKLGGKVFAHGEGGSGSVEYYFTKNFGFSAGGFGYANLYDLDAEIRYNHYGLTLGTDLWVKAQVRLGLDYQLAGSTVPSQLDANSRFIPPGNSSISNQVIGSVLLRLP